MSQKLRVDTDDVRILNLVNNFNYNSTLIAQYETSINGFLDRDEVPSKSIVETLIKLQNANNSILKTMKTILRESGDKKIDPILQLITDRLAEYD